MKISIIIPSYENFLYLELCILSLKKNSSYNHEIIVHINGNDPRTEKFLIKENILYTKSEKNIGLCSGVNLASRKASTNYIMYAHDDMYFLPLWDIHVENEVNSLDTKYFYLSLTHLSYMQDIKGDSQLIHFDCGDRLENFNETKLLNEYDKFEFRNLQGSHWAPHIIHSEIWNKVGGFSEEFNPGFASDPDLNKKLWEIGVRIFKGISKSRIYHFGSITARKNKKIIKNDGKKTFLIKWKFTVEFFTKHYLRRGATFEGPLSEPKITFSFITDFLISKLKYCLILLLK
jgi:glycosyltransferase involved in cell wall biosynthesis